MMIKSQPSFKNKQLKIDPVNLMFDSMEFWITQLSG